MSLEDTRRGWAQDQGSGGLGRWSRKGIKGALSSCSNGQPGRSEARGGAKRSGEGLGFEVGGAGVPEVRNESVCSTEGLTPSACQRSQKQQMKNQT